VNGPSKDDLNLELRRTIYDEKGKDITSSEDKDKQTNGGMEEVARCVAG
jgi:SWI/SNF related-matrix-associated actin-dependent regulator of chromatin subfamily C